MTARPPATRRVAEAPLVGAVPADDGVSDAAFEEPDLVDEAADEVADESEDLEALAEAEAELERVEVARVEDSSSSSVAEALLVTEATLTEVAAGVVVAAP